MDGAYVLATYYIGYSSRYDGSGNTDTASIQLFRTQEEAINTVISVIREEINGQIADNIRDDPKFDDVQIISRALINGFYNFEDHYMFTLVFTPFS